MQQKHLNSNIEIHKSLFVLHIFPGHLLDLNSNIEIHKS